MVQHSLQRQYIRAFRSGFTLIELVVVTAIIVVINARFGGVVQLENLAYDIALSIRQAQVYGISVQRLGATTFSAGYGVHFNTSDPTANELFGEADGKGLFSVDENVPPSPFSMTHGYSIMKLCAPAADESCLLPKADILFKRPEPDAWISDGETSCIQSPGTPGDCKDSVRIVLVSPRGDTMSVIVEANGQISVRRGPQ